MAKAVSRTRTRRAPARNRGTAPRSYIAVGGLDPSAHFLEDLRLPFDAQLPAVTYFRDALQKAIAERKGEILIGEKGTGRTMARQVVLKEFQEGEAAKHRADAAYRLKLICTIECQRSRDPLDVLDQIWVSVSGTPMPRRNGKHARSYEDLRNQLLVTIKSLNVVALIVDEAEFLTKEGLGVLRDLVSLAESGAEGRHSEGGYRAAGLGMVLLGTPDLSTRLAAHPELAHRWTRIQQVPPVENNKLPDLYLSFLPCLLDVAAKDPAAWKELVTQHLWQGADVPVRLVENHIREYVRYQYNLRADTGETQGFTLADVKYDENLFVAARKAMASSENVQGL